ncbi:MAG: hypothetical protein AAGH65_06195 [Pseudomonadota bacterium]
MLNAVVGLLLILGITVFPVMLAARIVGAPETGFGRALLAVILFVIADITIQQFVSFGWFTTVISFLIGAAILSALLKITFVQASLVGLIITAIQMAVFLLLFGSFFAAESFKILASV